METGQVAAPGGLPGEEAKGGDFRFWGRMGMFHNFLVQSSKFKVQSYVLISAKIF
jgi:hypothetical protein